MSIDAQQAAAAYLAILAAFAAIVYIMPLLIQPEYFYEDFSKEKMPDPLRWDHFDKAQIQDGVLILDSHGGREGDRFIATRDKYVAGTLTFHASWADYNNSYAGFRAGYNGPLAVFQPVRDGVKIFVFNGTNVSETILTQANPLEWHTYKIELGSNGTSFFIDDSLVHEVPRESVSFAEPLNIFLHGYTGANRMEVKWAGVER